MLEPYEPSEHLGVCDWLLVFTKGRVEMYDRVEVFSATKARDREELGAKITRWLRGNPDCEVVDTVVKQSSDREYHCVTVVIFARDTRGFR